MISLAPPFKGGANKISPESYKDVIENGGYYFYTEEDIAEVVGLVDEILGKND